MSEAPATARPAATEAGAPSLEIKAGLAVSAVPQVLALVIGGYGRLVVIGPLALALTIADAAALAVAILQWRADVRSTRTTSTLVWVTIALSVPWILYALYIGAVSLMVHVFCINQLCRGAIR